MKIKIAPSILAADFGRLNEEIASVEGFVDMIHVDVMDGHFVPNITIGPCVVKSLRSRVPLDVHLMIENPGKFVSEFVKAGASCVTVHSEACKDLIGVLGMIRELGAEAGVSIKPKTPVSDIADILDHVDSVLVMTVEPGFGGQEFMSDMIKKIKELRSLGFKGDIGVDGGINAETGRLCREAGANVLIVGSYIFKAEDKEKVVMSLRG